MSGFCYYNPTTRQRYYTAVVNDANVPAGYLLTVTSDGSVQFADGSHDQNLQQYQGGQASGGYPAYYSYGDGLGSDTNVPKNPNGILGG